MADTITTVQWTIDYQNDSKEKRTYELEVNANSGVDPATVIQGINASIDGGEEGELRNYFVDSQGNAMNKIVAARTVAKSEEIIF